MLLHVFWFSGSVFCFLKVLWFYGSALGFVEAFTVFWRSSGLSGSVFRFLEVF